MTTQNHAKSEEGGVPIKWIVHALWLIVFSIAAAWAVKVDSSLSEINRNLIQNGERIAGIQARQDMVIQRLVQIESNR